MSLRTKKISEVISLLQTLKNESKNEKNDQVKFNQKLTSQNLSFIFNTLQVLANNKASLFAGSLLPQAISLLTKLELRPGGPYQSYSVIEKKKVTDLAVNANIGFFLSRLNIELPNLNRLVESAIDKEGYSSPDYVTEAPVIYYISRFYKGRDRKKLTGHILKRIKNKPNLLDKLFYYNALLNLGYLSLNLERSIKKIKPQRLKNTYPFNYLPGKKGAKTGADSSDLNKNLYQEAVFNLAQQQKQARQKFRKAKTNLASQKIDSLYRKIVDQVQKDFTSFDKQTKQKVSAILRHLLSSDKKRQITLTPYFFAQSLKAAHSSQKKAGIPPKTLVRLGIANLRGWLAYTIYDLVYDEEADATLIPPANLALRKMTAIYYRYFNNPAFLDFFEKTMNELDCANAFELNHWRLNKCGNVLTIPSPIIDFDTDKLFQRAGGHILGPIALLYEFNYSPKSPQFKKTIHFFKHYLIAKQLNDDAHDWEKDLKNGIITGVTRLILKEFIKNKQKASHLDISKKTTELRKIFWYKTILNIQKEVLFHVSKAENSLPFDFFNRLILPIKTNAKKTIAEQKSIKVFLKNFSF